MASTYTDNLGIEKPGSGEQAGTWGTTTNTNFDIIDRAINGVFALSLSGTTTTLTTTDGALSNGGYKVLVLGGSPSGTNTITITPNDQDKVYLVKNSSGQTATFTQGSGGDASIINGETAWIFADGAGSGAAVQKASFIPDIVGDQTPQLGGMLDVNGNSIGDGTLELLKFSETGSAVNEFTITNAATGNPPQLSATGDDTNINLKLAGKGSGKLELASDLQINGTTNNWTIEVDSDDHLLFKYNGTAVFALQDNGKVIAADDITAFGTPT